jgi:hypothetical protein
MGEKIRGYIRQHHLALLCLFLIMSGGTAWANHGFPDTISSEDIIDAEVKTEDVANNAIGTGKIPDGAVRSSDVANDTTDFGLQAQDLEAGSVGTSEVADNALHGGDILDGSLGTNEIAEDTLYNDNSLNAGDVSDFGTLGTSEINEGSLFNDNSLIGADINESQLAKVPDADRLDGIDSSGFVQGQSGGGEVGLGRQVITAGGTDRTLLRGNLGTLVSICQSDGDAALKYVNSLLSPTVDVGDNIGAGTAYASNVGTGESHFVLDAQAPDSAAVGQIQVHTSASTTGPQKAVTFLVSARAAFNANDSCRFMGQLLYTGS